jgi:thymidylate synthase
MNHQLYMVTETDVNNFIRQLLQLVDDYGVAYVSAPTSMNNSRAIKEVLNTTARWLEPRRRLFATKYPDPKFRVGLAVARFFYMLSGSNELDPIAFYSPTVSKFSDDGITLPGSSYGHRIFGTAADGGQFERIASLISARPDTKRAQIAIYGEADAGRDSKDIPCVNGLVFMPRHGQLHCTLQMRANDAFRLLPYNLFEFSLLAECMAAQTGLKLGIFYHTAASLHTRAEGVLLARTVAREQVESPDMFPITTFSNPLRCQLVALENLIRTTLINCPVQLAAGWYQTLTGFEPIWLDLLGVLLLEARRVVHGQSPDLRWLQTQIMTIQPELVLVKQLA